MGNFNTTQRERKRELRRQLYEQQILAAAAAWQSRLQPVAPPPVAPNLSYDELVVAEANRRIEEEKRRIEAEKQKEIAIAEKKRFDDDVAEKIALAKNPGHVTRAMIAEATRERDRLAKLAAEEQQAKLNSIKDALASSGMCFEGKMQIELSIPLELYKLHKSARVQIIQTIRDVTAKRDEKYVTDMDVGEDLHPYLPLYNQLVYIQIQTNLNEKIVVSTRRNRPPHNIRPYCTINGVFDVFVDPPALWDDWKDDICTNVIGTIGYKEVNTGGKVKAVKALCWQRKDKQNAEKRKEEHDIAERIRLAAERDERNAKIIYNVTNGIEGVKKPDFMSVRDELMRIARNDLFENKENPVVFRNIIDYVCKYSSINSYRSRGYWVYAICIKCEHVPVNDHGLQDQHVTTIHDEVITKPHNYESILFNSVCSHKGRGLIGRNHSGVIPCWHDENA
jgi:hypothetical protein